ncbi:hypothetical protein R5O87_21155, partial [Arthrobacter globiformis]|uniref:hypothetical protein n=1 Tax=Arthrobacter globiformis TaxID=1665 RepID=UPI00397A4DDA
LKQQTHPAPPKPNIQDRSGATFQTYLTRRSFANQRYRGFPLAGRSPTRPQHTAKRTIFQAI